MIGKVGKKGEIYVPKKVRKEANLNPGDEVLVEVKGKELIIKKKESIVDVLMDEAVAKVSLDEMRSIREKVRKLLEI
ncbi:AbrB/MazE/SpoVT family DNA-binding domain-containing protein [Archaeoglobus profundus]|uniref:Transcriptional regulator, AbrB family n=1 Tax=Archaeoglobus profundus (strain DSM 5631 / JCM 9629 / NBRC 100127 / Av18) TaxID=572546 RepID=D2RFI0_ARCPA|nr:AbrB/MazE/SpoVT family DNA-binding domain-containing protein [Archaeoglobus profundus]ADB58874.1 transcriptional regulator, AbrB family [Archaeoglobus profundus DSM 5631]